jgi:hypothetical protein
VTSERRRAPRAAIAAVLTLTAAGAAVAIATLGHARYLDGYCWSRLPLPLGHGGGSGPTWRWPASIVCPLDGAPDVVVTDPFPLVWVVVCGAAGLLAVWLTWWWVAHASRQTASPGAAPDACT